MTMPSLNPIEAPDLVCTECGKVLRRKITTRNANGKLDAILYFCDSPKCQYGMSVSKEHKNAQSVRYEPESTVFTTNASTAVVTTFPHAVYTNTSEPASDEEAEAAEIPAE